MRQPGTIERVRLPDLGHVHVSVRQQLGAAYRILIPTALDPDASRERRADAYGRMGTLFLAAEFLDDAARCFRNAELLAPDAFRWPYYLGHVARRMGALPQAIESFERAHQRRPEDVTAAVWLSRILVDLGRPAAAQRLVTATLSRGHDAPALRFEAGRAALVSEDYAASVEHFEATLRLDPDATVVHYPLAMAHRQLGNLERADDHLKRRGGQGSVARVPVRLADPLMAKVSTLLQNPQYHRDLGFYAAANGDWSTAATQFRKAVDASPEVARLRLSLARALGRLGDAHGAERQLEEAVRLEPRLDEAHHDLGLLYARTGRDGEAIERFSTAVSLNPRLVPAQLGLADALRRSEHPASALTHYRRVLELEPANRQARFGEAMALVRLERYREARERLQAAMRVLPDRPEFPHALARLLAAAPRDAVRDGATALALVRPLAANHQTTAIAETMAMTLAELGSFDQAVEWQRIAMSIATRAERPDIAQRMADNLALYLRRQPCRTPWRDSDPDLRPETH